MTTIEPQYLLPVAGAADRPPVRFHPNSTADLVPLNNDRPQDNEVFCRGGFWHGCGPYDRRTR